MQRRKLLTAALASTLGLAALSTPALAQDAWPSKTIRFVVPYPPGGPTDLMARMLQPELQSRLGVTVIVDNKGGAGGNTGSAEVAKQAPTDLAPVVQISAFPLVLEVHPSLGVKTVAEFLALAKAGKPALSYASAGNGTPQHLAGELFNSTLGV